MTEPMTLPQNIHQLIRAHLAKRADGRLVQRPALLDQLAGEVQPSGGGQGGGNESPLPINTDAVELQLQLLHTAQQEEAERVGLTGPLDVILDRWAREDRPETVAHLVQVTRDMIDSIHQIVDPAPARRPLRKACPACGVTWICNENGDRKAALTAGVWDESGGLRPTTDWDISCAECGAVWHAADPGFNALIGLLSEAA
ncbi:hypothetical protein [Nesterenkonia sp. HG001]|uniref:DUF7341 domain-containing protein n=1 Tax=Nesterenkonia sp. HG001 TaxID=2983207 RepID=UPI002AC5BFBF|nr:hypothetical protein [Nesterenkonia sp. HG001]MDZ5077883.1 hypothetical protein [Nesterenkonia sp. HG001]